MSRKTFYKIGMEEKYYQGIGNINQKDYIKTQQPCLLFILNIRVSRTFQMVIRICFVDYCEKKMKSAGSPLMINIMALEWFC